MTVALSDGDTLLVSSLVGVALVFTVLLPIGLYLWVVIPFCNARKANLKHAQQAAVAEAQARTTEALTHEGSFLTFKNVMYSVRVPGNKPLRILRGVDGVLPAGTLTAIMGPSGCGKSTLLDILADAKTSGTISGDIRMDGEVRPSNYRSFAAYVMQSDNTHTHLTVRETLTFAAELRLPYQMPNKEKMRRVEETLVDVGLEGVADNRIGDDSSGGLSGGQRRRVTVAIELISRPRLLFLDEPTSGLDAYGALQVVSSLRRFATRGQAIACTIHQPRADIFALFDRLLLMAAGEMVYFGPVGDIYSYFEKVGVKVDRTQNPADLIVDLTHSPEEEEHEGVHDDGRPSVSALIHAYAHSHKAAALLDEIDRVNADAAAAAAAAPLGRRVRTLGLMREGRYANSLVRQTVILVRRMYLVDSRNAAYVFGWVLNGVVLALQGLTYIVIVRPPESDSLETYRANFQAAKLCNAAPALNPPTLNEDIRECGYALSQQTGVARAHAALLFMVLNALFVNELTFVPMIHAEKKIFFREHAAAAHSISAWHLAWLIKMLLSAACKALVYTPAFYFLAQLELNSASYLVAMYLTGAMGFAGSATSMMVTALVPTLGGATSSFTALALFYQNVCGFYLAVEVLPEFIAWTSYLSVYFYAYTVFLFTQVDSGTGFDEGRSTVFIVLSGVFVYLFGLLFHIFGLSATWMYNVKRAKYVDDAGVELSSSGPRRLTTRRSASEHVDVAPKPRFTSRLERVLNEAAHHNAEAALKEEARRPSIAHPAPAFGA